MTHVEHFSGDASYHVEITTDLAARGTGTRMTMVMRYANAEARAAAIANGFTDSLDEVYGKLETLQPRSDGSFAPKPSSGPWICGWL